MIFRYALRNQQKIAQKLGNHVLLDLRKSLDGYFSKDQELVVKEFPDIKPGVAMKGLLVKSSKDEPVTHTFLITRITFNVYNLAYYGTNSNIGG